MTRLRSVLVLVLAPLLVLSACSDPVGAAPAATVDGTEISDSDFRDLLRMLAENPEFALGLVGVPVHADGSTAEGRVDSAFAAAVLEFEILLTMVADEFEARGLEITPEELATTESAFQIDLTAHLAELPDDYVATFTRWNTQVRLLQTAMADEVEVAEVTDADVRAFYDENLDQFDGQVCSSHILVETEDEALGILDELEAGGDFAAIAEERSTDTGSGADGGDLGCTAPTNFVGPFADAVTEGAIGEHLGPVQTDFGYHVILVRSRGTTPFEELEADIRAQLESEAGAAQSGVFGTWLTETVTAADVTVHDRYGTWNAEVGQVIPPESPAGGTSTVSF